MHRQYLHLKPGRLHHYYRENRRPDYLTGEIKPPEPELYMKKNDVTLTLGYLKKVLYILVTDTEHPSFYLLFVILLKAGPRAILHRLYGLVLTLISFSGQESIFQYNF